MLKLKTLLHEFFNASIMGVPETRFQESLLEWGPETVISGLEVIRDRIRNMGDACPDVMNAGPYKRVKLGSTKPGCMQAFNVSWHMESAFSWVLEELVGTKVSEDMLFKLLPYSDYDIAILSARLLNWNEHKKERVTPSLLTSFNSRNGTAFRLASAMTLYSHGIKEPLELVAVPNLITSISSLEVRLSDEEKNKQKEEFMATDPDSDEIQEFLLEGIGNPLTRFLSRADQIITWDIATRGKGPKNKWPDWWVRE